MMLHRLRLAIFLLTGLLLSACSSVPPAPESNLYVGRSEADIRAELGAPADEFSGYYGLPSLEFTRQFTGEIKTMVFQKPGGHWYVSFEKRREGWICICSTWLDNNAEF